MASLYIKVQKAEKSKAKVGMLKLVKGNRLHKKHSQEENLKYYGTLKRKNDVETAFQNVEK